MTSSGVHMILNVNDDIADNNDRYARHHLIKWWNQERLHQSHVMVVGAGAVGNEVLKTLALLGVGRLTIVDFDVIEASNLSRTVLFTAADVGQSKAVAAAAAVERLNPDVRCEAVHGDLEVDVGIGTVRSCDLVLGCVDSVNARWAINRISFRAGVPWINTGINEDSVEVAVFDPANGACYECGMTDSMWHRFNERRSCMLLMKALPPRIVPTTSVVASLAASLQVNEAVCLLHERQNRLRAGQKAFFATNPYSFFVVDLQRDPDCPAHERYTPETVYEGDPDSATVDDLLTTISGANNLQLDFDLVVGLACSSCGAADRHLGPARRVTTVRLPCPRCGALRVPSTATEIARNSPLSSVTLRELGIPSRAILRVQTNSGSQFVQLTR